MRPMRPMRAMKQKSKTGSAQSVNKQQLFASLTTHKWLTFEVFSTLFQRSKLLNRFLTYQGKDSDMFLLLTFMFTASSKPDVDSGSHPFTDTN